MTSNLSFESAKSELLALTSLEPKKNSSTKLGHIWSDVRDQQADVGEKVRSTSDLSNSLMETERHTPDAFSSLSTEQLIAPHCEQLIIYQTSSEYLGVPKPQLDQTAMTREHDYALLTYQDESLDSRFAHTFDRLWVWIEDHADGLDKEKRQDLCDLALKALKIRQKDMEKPDYDKLEFRIKDVLRVKNSSSDSTYDPAQGENNESLAARSSLSDHDGEEKQPEEARSARSSDTGEVAEVGEVGEVTELSATAVAEAKEALPPALGITQDQLKDLLIKAGVNPTTVERAVSKIYKEIKEMADQMRFSSDKPDSVKPFRYSSSDHDGEADSVPFDYWIMPNSMHTGLRLRKHLMNPSFS